jgi:methionyl-tRNA formyltransferase
MKIVFLGTPEFAVPSLKMLSSTKNIEILTVVTQPDKAVGRKQILTAPPIKTAALDLGLPIIQPKNKQSLIKSLKDLKADFFVVIAFGMILPKEILEIPEYGCINVHASLLPKYRGASPIQESLLNGDKETGITIIKIDEELDHGDIFFIKRVPIETSDTLDILSHRLAEVSSIVLPLVLHDIMNRTLSPLPQIHKNATFCRKIYKEDGKINLALKTAKEVSDMIKAYTPWPSVYTSFNGKKIQILETAISTENLSPGKFILENNILKIGTKKGSLLPKIVQLEGKKPMDIKSFINGYKQFVK